ncbi:MAG: hypothetical protein OEM41_08055 [Ignavibacteria bacterium]|nr:hypothetical protein [Ignavibacteria bacterium]
MPSVFHTLYRPALFCLILAGISFLLNGCLIVGSKEYRITLRPDNSGEATIRFIDILSEADDTADVSQEDFRQLIEFYLQGNQLEKDNPGFRNAKKRLYEENGLLVGEIRFTFDSIQTVRVFQFNPTSPYMYFVGSPLSSEQLIESNGSYGRDWMPVVFWPRGTKELYVKTRVVSDALYQKSLLPFYREWAGRQKSKQH